jgi:hypothetical protein
VCVSIETAIAEIARSPAATSTNSARAFEALHSSSTPLPVSTATGDSVTQRCFSVAVTPSLRSDTVTLPCRSWAFPPGGVVSKFINKWVQIPPGDRSSRKQPEQLWR